VPNNDTYVTGEHKIFYNREMIKAKNIVNGLTIKKVEMKNEIVYNVLLEGYKIERMIANGMISETLCPNTLMVKMLMKLNNISDKERMTEIMEYNKGMRLEHERRKKIEILLSE